MSMRYKIAMLILLSAVGYSEIVAQGRRNRGPKPMIWSESGRIDRKDLRYGPGSASRAPVPPFRFVKEDKKGESPKFEIRDANNVEWVVKLGPEAQSETVVSRIVWSMGYFVDEAYFFPESEILGLPKLSRGRDYVAFGNRVLNAKFEPRRAGVKRGASWDWLKNPFVGTREFNGLKTLMVVFANYDTSPANNRIVQVGPPERSTTQVRYVVTDLGATLGKVGGLGGKRSKNDLSDYRSSEIVKRVTKGITDFQYRTRPTGLGYVTFVFHPPYWRSQTAKEKAMRKIPTRHVRWMADRLALLRDEQLADAFDHAGYDPITREGYIDAIRSRIRELYAVDGGRRTLRAELTR